MCRMDCRTRTVIGMMYILCNLFDNVSTASRYPHHKQLPRWFVFVCKETSRTSPIGSRTFHSLGNDKQRNAERPTTNGWKIDGYFLSSFDCGTRPEESLRCLQSNPLLRWVATANASQWPVCNAGISAKSSGYSHYNICASPGKYGHQIAVPIAKSIHPLQAKGVLQVSVSEYGPDESDTQT